MNPDREVSGWPPTSSRKSLAVQTFSSNLQRSGSLDSSISVKDLFEEFEENS